MKEPEVGDIWRFNGYNVPTETFLLIEEPRIIYNLSTGKSIPEYKMMYAIHLETARNTFCHFSNMNDWEYLA
jgi:hypothetical protein